MKSLSVQMFKSLSLAALLMAGAAMTFTACSDDDNIIVEQPVNLTKPEVYTMTVEATKGDDATTRALSLDGNILSATWAEGEEVTVYNETKKEELTGTLKAQSSGASTTLKGEISGSIDVDDVLTLKFLSPNYDSQEGTLEYIAAHCDYATASVTVTGVDGGDISTGTANFVNQQAIVRFELSKPNGYEGLYTRSVKIVADNEIITVTLSAETKDVYVALPAISGKKLVIGASSYSDNDKYYYIKSTASFQSGKYYSISVKMKDGAVVFNESELNSAVSDKAPYIVLGSDIPLSSQVSIPSGKTLTLDLNGQTLSRSLSECNDLGNVIRISTGGTLTVRDSSGDDSGTITGGRATNGGGICNHGTLAFEGGTISSCMASSCGGAIFNAPSTAGGTPATLYFTGGKILGNWGEDCGGIFNYSGSTLTMSGGVIRGNTSNAGGGGVVNYGTANITDGTIYNNTATTRGGGIWNGGTLTLDMPSTSGGIKGNKCNIEGGGIYIKSGSTVTINGCTISNNYAEQKGGGIYNAGTLSIGNMTNGVWITENSCKGEGGGIYENGTLNMQGLVQVKRNANVTAGSMDSNLCLASGKKINVTGNMGGGSFSNIRVYCENYQEQVITSGYNTATGHEASVNFQSDVAGFTLYYENKELLFYKRANGTPIRYLDRNWDEGTGMVVETMRLVFAENIADVFSGNGQTNLDGYYYVTGTVETDDKLYASGEVHLILCDGASLTANSLVCDEYPVHIYGQTAGTGQFIATDPDSGYPGIGCHKKDGKTVYIAGGVITVKGASNCAGIGGGYYQDSSTTISHQYCSSIYIYGGTINATGGSEAAGIGGSGNSYWFGDIYIYGGSVTAQGGSSPAFDTDGGGAGIGGGDLCPNGGDIYVKGGTVNATGGDEAAGIGIGQNEINRPLNTHIYISGGTVTATGGARGAGIGGGDGVSGCSVYIYGGTVKAYAGTDAAGIGSGEGADDNNGGRLTITGGFVEATGAGYGAGLGAGEDAALGQIEITGGTVIAHGGADSKAICSHKESGTNSIIIGKTMRLRVSENILSYTERELGRLSTYDNIQLEPCTHNGNPCEWCMKGR